MFNTDKFERTQFEPRKAEVQVPGLSAFFDGANPVWTVRGLNSSELHKAIEAGKRQGNVENIIKAISAGGDQVEALRKALGLSKETPGEIVKRLEMLVVGSVSPVITLPIAVKLAEAFPVEFMTLTNQITELTGMGYDLVKPAAALQTIPG